MAYYLPPGVDFEESGQTYTDAWNEPGLVQGNACVPRQYAPTIVEGGIRLPFAQTMWKEEDSGVVKKAPRKRGFFMYVRHDAQLGWKSPMSR